MTVATTSAATASAAVTTTTSAATALAVEGLEPVRRTLGLLRNPQGRRRLILDLLAEPLEHKFRPLGVNLDPLLRRQRVCKILD
jgi:hypothetical protein